MPNGPLSLYRSRRGTGTLKADAAQEYAAERLQSLFQALREYRPAMGKVGWRARFGLTRRPDPADKRVVKVRLLAPGVTAVDGALETLMQHERAMLADLDPADQAAMAASLRRLLLPLDSRV